ncbi:MAG TPA: DPP IV N-terminal domain-containing protein [Rhodothermales bacterium]|nr:DPP IV N-terminal domain-containing protein [Rhodothermales bacterium]
MTRTTPLRLLSIYVVLLILSVAPTSAQQADRPTLTLEDIHASNTFSGDSFRGGRWADEGPVVWYIEQDRDTGASNLISYNLETDERTRLIDGTKLDARDVGKLIQIEGYAYSKDGSKVLLYTDSERVWRQNTKGFYYVYDTTEHTLTPIADRDKGFQMFAKFNPQADAVAFVRDRNLFVVDLDTMEETQLTDDGSEGGIINGTFDWVYEEEFGLRDGWSWSPDGSKIAFFKLDETNTRDFAMTDLRELYPTYERFRYPKAGETNSEVQVGVIDMATKAISFVDTDTWESGGDEHEYIARMGWTPEIDGESKVWMFRLNRDQNDLDFLYADAGDNTVETVLNEQEDTWIDVENDKLTFLDDGEHFVWQSETSGYNHLYLYNNDGTLVTPITSGPWDVTGFEGIDEATGTAYFTAAIESPLERHLYSIKIDMEGSGEEESMASPVKISDQPGTHGINMSGDLNYYIDSYSNATTPTTVTLYNAQGEEINVLEDNQELIDKLATYNPPAPEFTQVPGADGTMLNAYLIKPADFDPNKAYPLLMYVYGGPGSQTVRDAWGGSRYLWHAYLADSLDIIVASVDNRGTGGRGKDFKSDTYKRLGDLEAKDQIAAAQHLGSMDFIDADRVGIWGWSYGGYMTLLSMLYEDGPETFKLGVSVAPVTDWRLYDTIYTERYMSTPQKNEEGYTMGAPQQYADRMHEDQKLLIIHGDFDDNVHFQNTVQMANALQDANKQFELMMYPGRNHGIYGGTTRLHLFTLATNFIRENL